MSRSKKSKKPIRSERPRGVPADALFINETELTNPLIKAGCAMTVSSVMRLFYLVAGVVLGVAAILFRIFMDVDVLSTVLVLVLGLMLVWQGNRLPMESAARMIRQVSKAGDDARHRVYFATETEFGVVLADGTVHRFPWAELGTFAGNPQVMAITLRNRSILFCLSMTGFTKGQPGDFVVFLNEHMLPVRRNAIQRLADRVFHTLDDWALINADEIAAQKAKKDAKWARKQAKLDAKLARKNQRNRKGRN